MGVQFIFVVETNKKCNSDWIYIKDTVENFYVYERSQVNTSNILNVLDQYLELVQKNDSFCC